MGMAAAKGKAAKQSESSAPEAAVGHASSSEPQPATLIVFASPFWTISRSTSRFSGDNLSNAAQLIN